MTIFEITEKEENYSSYKLREKSFLVINKGIVANLEHY